MAPTTNSLPPQSVPFVGPDGLVSQLWYTFLNSIFGQGSSTADALNDLTAPQGANEFLAAPAGESGEPSYRTLVSSDLDSTAGQYPGTTTNDSAEPGNVGEYIESQIASGSAVGLSSTKAADITTIELTPGDWDVWGNLALSAAQTAARGWINTQSATDPGAPNMGAYASWTTEPTMPVGMMQISVAETTTLYLSINATFTGAVSGYGFLGARRRR